MDMISQFFIGLFLGIFIAMAMHIIKKAKNK